MGRDLKKLVKIKSNNTLPIFPCIPKSAGNIYLKPGVNEVELTYAPDGFGPTADEKVDMLVERGIGLEKVEDEEPGLFTCRVLDGDNPIVTNTVNKGDSWNPSVTKTGYTITYLNYVKPVGRASTVLELPITNIQKDTDLYIKYKIDTHTITFVTNGGSEVLPLTVDYNTVATKPEDPTKDSDTFEGWYTDEGLSAPYTWSTPVINDFTLYAKWTPAGA